MQQELSEQRSTAEAASKEAASLRAELDAVREAKDAQEAAQVLVAWTCIAYVREGPRGAAPARGLREQSTRP